MNALVQKFPNLAFIFQNAIWKDCVFLLYVAVRKIFQFLDVLFLEKIIKNNSRKFKRNSKFSARDENFSIHVPGNGSKTMFEFQRVACRQDRGALA